MDVRLSVFSAMRHLLQAMIPGHRLHYDPQATKIDKVKWTETTTRVEKWRASGVCVDQWQEPSRTQTQIFFVTGGLALSVSRFSPDGLAAAIYPFLLYPSE
jgi:hypothetical protein